LLNLVGQPFSGRLICGRPGAMVALSVKGLKHGRNTLLNRTQ